MAEHFDPNEVAHRDDCYEIEPGRSCDCPTLGEIRERSMRLTVSPEALTAGGWIGPDDLDQRP